MKPFHASGDCSEGGQTWQCFCAAEVGCMHGVKKWGPPGSQEVRRAPGSGWPVFAGDLVTARPYAHEVAALGTFRAQHLRIDTLTSTNGQ